MASTIRYFISGSGYDVTDLRSSVSEFSLLGETFVFTGSGLVNTVYAAPGVTLDARNLLGGEDVVFFSYSWSQYTKDITSIAGAIVFSATVNGVTERVIVSNGASSAGKDKLVFADGSVITDKAKSALTTSLTATTTDIATNWNSAITTSNPGSALPTMLNATLRGFASTATGDTNGATFTMPEVGVQHVITGTGLVDKVYVKAGANVDARNLLGGADVVYFTGNWADYTKDITTVSGAIKFTRTVNAVTETVLVSNGASSAGKDQLVFADGAVITDKAKLALTSSLTTAITAVAGYDALTTTPGLSDIATIVIGGVGPGVDNTYATGDVIEFDVAMKKAVTVTGTEVFTFKIGSTDVTATLDVAASTLTAGVPSVLKFKHTVVTSDGVDTNGISYAANAITGGSIKVASTNTDAKLLHVAAADMSTYIVDAVAPTAPVLTLGTGVEGGATLAEATQAGGVVTVNAETGASTVVTFTNGTKTVTKTVTGTGAAQAVALSSQDVTTLTDGTITVSVVATDAAGNASASASSSFVLDTAAPTAPVLTLGTGVAGGVTLAEATQTGGVVTVNAETGASTVVTFTNGTKTVTKTVTGTGAAQAVALSSQDVTTLTDGTITVSVVATDAAGNASASASSSFVLDTVAPTLHASVLPATALSTIAGTAGNTEGESITLTVTFDDAVMGLTNGTNSTVFTLAGVGVTATWSGVDNTNTRTLTYTVTAGQSGQVAIDEVALKIALVAGISDVAGNAFTYDVNNGAIPNIDVTLLPVVDTQAPAVTGVSIVGANSSGVTKTGTLVSGDLVRVTLTTGEDVLVTGSPTYSIGFDSGSKQATFNSTLSTARTLVFDYTVVTGDNDTLNGLTSASGALSLNGSTMRDSAGNTINLTVPNVALNTNNIVVMTNGPSQTIVISNVTDNVGVLQASLTGNNTTDDTTLQLNGTISASLGSGDVIAIYDNDVKIATVSNTTGAGPYNWTYTTSVLGSGQHNFSARVENSATGLTGFTSATFAVNVFAVTPTINGVSDTVGTVIGNVVNGGSTDDTRPTLTGTLPVSLLTGESIKVFDGATEVIGKLTVSGTSWSFQPSSALSDAIHSLTIKIVASDGSTVEMQSPIYTITTQAPVTPTQTTTITSVKDNVNTNGSVGNTTTSATVGTGTSTDDTTPTLYGTVSAALTSGQVVAVYDTVDGVKVKLGNANMSGTTWDYTPSTLSAGAHSLTAVVENSVSGVSSAASAAYVLDIHNSLNTTLTTTQSGQYIGRYIYLLREGNTSNWFTCSEIQVFSGGVNLALGKTVTAYTGSPSAVVDGKTSTIYTSAGTNSRQWLQVDLGATCNFDSISIYGDGGGATDISNFSVYVASTSMSGLTSSQLASSAIAAVAVTPTTINATTPYVSTPILLRDNLATLRGTLGAPIGSGEEIGVYDTVNGVVTKLGVATVNGLSWMYQSTTALADGAHSVKAMVQAQGETTGTLGRVVSSSTVFTVDTSTPTQTTTITSVKDNVNTNGSVGNTTTSATVGTGTSTDDTTPTLYGTVSAALTGAQVVAVYDTVDGVKVKLGNANMSGTTWDYTPSTLSAGAHSLTAVVENSASGVSSAASAAYVLDIHNSLTTSLTDSVGAVQGVIAAGGVTDDNKATLRGTLGAPIGSGEEIGVYDTVNGVVTKLGVATVNGLSWMYQSTTALADGAHSVKAMVQAQGETTGTLGRVVSSSTVFTVDTSTPTQTTTITSVKDNVNTNGSVGNTTTSATVGTGTSTDDTTPTLYGTVSAALTSGQVVAVYDTVNGVKVKLGNANMSGTTWDYTPSTLSAGAHSLTAVVENSASGVSSAASAAYVLDIHNSLNTTLTTTQSGQYIGRYIYLLREGNTSNWFTCSEIQVFSGGVNLALGKTVTAYTGSPSAVVDGSTSTIYSSAGTNSRQWLQVDLGATYNFDSISIYGDGGGATDISNFSVYVASTSMSGLTSSQLASSAIAAVAVTPATINATTPYVSTPILLRDNLATLRGTLGAPIGSGEEIGVYDTVNGVVTKLGVATVNGLSWMYQSTTALADGAHSVKAMVQAQGETTGTLGRVVSSSTVFTVDTSTPTQTTTITSVKDNVNTNGSVGNTTTSATVGTGTSTDDTTPTLYGTVSAALTSGQVVAVYDTVNGVKVKLGNANMSGTTWDYTPSTLSAGAHSLTAVVENSASGVSSAASAAYVLDIHNSLTTSLTDSVGAVQGVIAAGGVTDDNKATLSGTLSTALAIGEELAVYDTVNGVASKIGVATLNGQSWTYTPMTALSDGVHSIQAMVQSVGETTGVAGRVVSSSTAFTVDTTTPTQTTVITSVTDNVSTNGSVGNTTTSATVGTGTSTDDTTPTLSGTISGALTGAQVVGVYDTVAGVKTKLGNATVTGTTWSYTPSALSAGAHSLTAVVENSASGAQAVSSGSYAVGIQTVAMNGIVDATGSIKGNLFEIAQPNTSARYVRIDQVTYGIFDISELQVWAWVNGQLTNVAQSKTVVSHYTASSNGAFTNLTDGNTGTDFISANASIDNWVQIDLGADYNIFSISVVPNNAATNITSLNYAAVRVSKADMSTYTSSQLAANTAVASAYLNVAIVGSNQLSWSKSFTSDESMPTLSGTLAATLGTNEVVGIWDGNLRLGSANVNGNSWSYSVGALSTGVHSLIAKIENASGQVLAATETYSYTMDATAATQGVLIKTVTDSYGPTTGALVSGALTDDRNLTLSGVVGVPTLTSNQMVAVYDGTSRLGYATMSGTSWSYTISPSALSYGSHSLVAQVENTATGNGATSSSAFLVDVQQIALTGIADANGAFTGNVLSSSLSYVDAAGKLYTTASGTSTTDSVSPVLSGTLGHALDQTQVLAVYDGSTRLGNAVVVDKNWTYSTSNLSVGSHALAFQIESNATPGTSLLKTASYALTVVSPNTDLSPSSSMSLNGSNQILDLTQESGISWTNVLKSIDLTGLSSNTLLLKASDIVQKATVGGVEKSGVYANNYQLMINGNATSKVDLTDGSGTLGWTMQSTQKSIGSTVYDVWVNDGNNATLYINHAITSVI